MNKLTTMLALAGAALLPLTARAASTISDPPDGDFILGFQTTDGSDSSNLEVDLGSYSQFDALIGTGTTINLTLGASHTAGYGAFAAGDLTTAFGSPLPSSLDFGVVGAIGATNEAFIGESGTHKPGSKTSGDEPGTIAGIYAGFNPTDDTNATAGSTDTIIAKASQNSFESIAGNNGTYSGYFGNTLVGFPGTGSASLTLYDVPQTGTTPTKIGTVTLNNDVLTFTATGTAPEPSTYAMMAAGLVLLVAIRRWMTLNV